MFAKSSNHKPQSHFPSALQNKTFDKVPGAYKKGAGGISELFCSEELFLKSKAATMLTFYTL